MNRMIPFLAATVLITSLAPTAANAAVTKPIVKVIDITVDSIEATEDGLLANATVVLDVVGRVVTQDVQIPIDVAGTEATDCDILHLALGPIELNLLGLVVELDDCADGPVIVDITAVPGGGLLGDLLCSLAEGLDAGRLLGDLLADLSEEDLDTLLTGVVDVLNGVLDELLSKGLATASDVGAAQAGHRCDILNLAIDKVFLNLLGLQVETSPICLDIFALRGRGNLLGNLLCELSELLDNSAKQSAIDKVVKKIRKELTRRGL